MCTFTTQTDTAFCETVEMKGERKSSTEGAREVSKRGEEDVPLLVRM